MTVVAYEYDVNSAYPAALTNVPNLTVGEWIDNETSSFTLYHLKFSGGDPVLPGPLFCRHENGTVSYPPNVTGWYWTPEYDSALEYVSLYPGHLDVLETMSYVWDESDETSYPFRFITPLYEQRRRLKAAGDGSHVGIKLGLNSMYGKLAQQVGWMPATEHRPLRIPPYHKLEWAGYATSWCRSRVLSAGLENLSSVVAFETDALFTTEPLSVPVGTDLGEWEETRFRFLAYVQSGMYFATTMEGVSVVKTRGVDKQSTDGKKSLSVSEIIHALDTMDVPTVEATMTRFVGARLALAQDFDRWRHWETLPKQINLGPSGKRIPCDSANPAHGMIRSIVPFLEPMDSREFPIEWINPDPLMDMLEEMRRDQFSDWGWDD
jgi:hypothetical protein